MASKNLKALVLFLSMSTLFLSCSDDSDKSENLLFDHIWNYGNVNSTNTSNGFTFNVNGQYQGTLVFNSNGSYASNVIGGTVTVTSNFPGSSPQTSSFPAPIDNGTYVYLESSNKIKAVSSVNPDTEAEYYIHEITSNKLILKIDLAENGLQQEGFYYITLTR